MEQINSFEGGLDLDTSYNKYDNKKYLYLSGGVVLTQEGNSSFAIETEKGFKPLFTFPVVNEVYKISLFGTTAPNTFLNISIFVPSGPIPIVTNLDVSNISSTEALSKILREALSPFGDTVITSYSPSFNNISIRPVNNLGFVGLIISFSNTENINFQFIGKQNNVKIIGSGNYKNTVYLITASDNSNIGQIWEIKIDPVSKQVYYEINENKVIIPFGGELSNLHNLLYTDELNLDREHYITKVICSPETDNIFRIYFNDRKNPIKSFNKLVDVPMNYPRTLLEASLNISFPKIEITKVLNGGLIPVGSVVEYFYRYRSRQGGTISVFSLGSGLFNLTATNPTNNLNNIGFKGSALNEALNATQDDLFKSVQVKIDNLSNDYEFVEIYRLIYEQEETATLYLAGEVLIPPSRNIEFIDDGNLENQVNEELLKINETVFNINRANDIAVKDNRLIAVGIETSKAELDWDTRAYRINEVGELKLTSPEQDDIVVNINNFNNQQEFIEFLKTIPKDHDCINPYNKEGLSIQEADDWQNNKQYKFKFDGTLGGEGVNISYRFITYALRAEENATLNRTDAPYIFSGRFPSDSVIDLGANGVYDVSNEFSDFRSPKINSFLKGYARSEVYRVAFQAFDLKGNPFYTSWIADIKMPSVSDSVFYITENNELPLGFNAQNTNKFINGERVTLDNGDNIVKVYSLGLEFELKNLHEIEDRVSGYCFVAVKRTQQNKTKLAQGLLSPFIHYGSQFHPGGPRRSYISPRLHSSTFSLFPQDDTANPNFRWSANLAGKEASGFNYNLSVLFSIDDLIPEKAVKFRQASDYIQQELLYTKEGPAGFNLTYSGSRIRAFRENCDIFVNTFLAHQRFQLIDSKWKAADMSMVLSHFDYYKFPPQNSGANNHVIYTTDTPQFFKLLVNNAASTLRDRIWLHNKMRILLGFDTTGVNKINYNIVDVNNDLLVNNDPDNNPLLMVGSYKRVLPKQYGGDTFLERQENLYEPISNFINIDNKESIKVFNGDTIVSYFAFRTVHASAPADFNFQTVPDRRPNYVVKSITESSLNPYFDIGISWFRNELSEEQAANIDQGLGLNVLSELIFNNVYSTTNKSKIFSAKPVLVNDISQILDGLFVSDLKLPGDRLDSWLIFRQDNYKRADGIYGPINYVENFKDKLVFLQERAIGIQAINEQAITFNDETGQKIVLGDGELVGGHGYISTTSGTIHQSSVVISEFGLYYYDALLRKIKLLNMENNLPLSDALSIFSFLENTVGKSNLSEVDKHLVGQGVHSVVDLLTKRVYFTFLDYKTSLSSTIVYNENLKSFEFFAPYTPYKYINAYNYLLSENPINNSQVVMHNIGDFNTYYNEEKSPLVLKVVLNQPAMLHKVFNNVIINSEAYNELGEYLSTVGVTKIRVYNNYQDTGYKTNIKKVLRNFSAKIGFNILSNKKDRIRNPWAILELVFENNNNSRLVLHDIITKIKSSYSSLDKF